MSKILVLGGSYLQSPFVETSVEEGHNVTVIDRDPFCYCQRISGANFRPIDLGNFDSVLTLCKDIKPDAVIAPVNELGNVIAARISGELGLNYNSPEVVEVSRDKYKLRKLLETTGLLKPYYQVMDENSEPGDHVAYPVMIKPTNSSSSKGVELIYKKEELQRAIKNAREYTAPGGTIILEQFIEGEQFSIETISANGEHLIAGITKEEISDPPYFFERYDIQSPEIHKKWFPVFEPFIQELLSTVGVKIGPCHVEVKVKDGQVYPIDFATRSGGWRDILINLSGNTDYNRLILDSYLKNSLSSINKPSIAVAAGILMFPEDLNKYISAKKEGGVEKEYFYSKGPAVQPKSLADSFGYFFVSGEVEKFRLNSSELGLKC